MLLGNLARNLVLNLGVNLVPSLALCLLEVLQHLGLNLNVLDLEDNARAINESGCVHLSDGGGR